MKRTLTLAVAVLMSLTGPLPGADAPPPNTLTAAEKSAGWQLLFDGKSLDGWRANESPATFSVQDGQMTFPKANSGVYFPSHPAGPRVGRLRICH